MGRQGDADKFQRKLRQLRKQRARGMRRAFTPSEQQLWDAIKDEQLGVNFRPQEVIHRWIVDFYCAELKLIVEVDGSVHLNEKRKAKDEIRDAWLVGMGYRILRLPSPRIRYTLDRAIGQIREYIDGRHGDCAAR